jgi:hypothetical protein
MHSLRHRRFAAWCFLLCAAGAVRAGGLSLPTQPDSALEHRVKAAFLYNFTRFVDWPTNAFTSGNARFVIGVLGDESLVQALEQTVKRKTVGGRVIEARRIPDATGIQPCQILFVAHSQTAQLAHVLAALGSAHVLLVGETPGFMAAGGAINFTNDEGRVRFEVNLAAAEHAGVKISSKLLRLATLVIPPARGDRE